MRKYYFLALTYLILAIVIVRADSISIAQLKKLAEKGDVQAQCGLGIAYWYGTGVPQDYMLAVYWYRKAAEQGNALAQWTLGNAYRDGKGVPQDYVQAVYWLRKAAEQGNADAKHWLKVLETVVGKRQ
ncbi:tetratricopeptide repeat protein [Candidatus Methylacidiphilum infernorum]|uniref:tetratricopeptide repeat protein n=1 Tax=Candidatus Methylacidiphilum infernorum TaxID=511746 RepID=UPI001F5DD8B3|nr:tetratricopeptide repeat protein [Candidatus Methylacidiphilum infernorum]